MLGLDPVLQFREDGQLMINRTRQRAGIEGAKLHDLRKTFATMLAKNRVSDMVIQNVLGHAPGSDVTAKNYIGIDEGTQAALEGEGNKMAKKLRAVKGKVEKKIKNAHRKDGHTLGTPNKDAA